MEFKTWLEQKWHNFGSDITLYHGTSSALLDRIQKDGIKPPKKDFYAYGLEIVKYYLGKVPEELRTQIASITGSREDILENVIYLSTDQREATTYAKTTYKFGGEIHMELWRTCNYWLVKQKNAQKPDFEDVHIKPRYDESQPVVLEVEVPYEWMMTTDNLRTEFDWWLQQWKNGDKKHYRSFQDYLDEQGFEVRIKETVPPSMIKKIHNAREFYK